MLSTRTNALAIYFLLHQVVFLSAACAKETPEAVPDSQAVPQWEAAEDWLKPAPGEATIGAAHGDVAVSSSGEVYVSVGGRLGGIQVFAADGTYLRNVPKASKDFHGFVIRQRPDGEFIFGARRSGQPIEKMTLDGEVVLQIQGSQIPDRYKLKDKDGNPRLDITGVDVAPDGRIFAVDGYASDFIHVFSPEGRYLKSFGGREAPYKFQTCHKLAIDTRFDPPRIICCDREHRRMVNLSLDGEVLSVIPNMKRPAAVAILGDLAAVGEIEGRVSFLDKHGKRVRTVGENLVKQETATDQVKPEDWRTGILTAPHGLDFDAAGNLFVTEFNRYGRVLRYDRNNAEKSEKRSASRAGR